MFVLMMVAISGGKRLMHDRTQGRFLRLDDAPVSALELYVGKILGGVLLGLVQSLLLLGAGTLLFRIPLGDSPVLLVPLILSLAVFAGCLSIFFGVLCQTEKQVVNIAIFVAVALAALGGCWWPIEIVPENFKIVAKFTPSYWAMHGLQRVMYFNKSYEVLILECPVLLTYATGVLLLALPLLGRRQSSTG